MLQIFISTQPNCSVHSPKGMAQYTKRYVHYLVSFPSPLYEIKYLKLRGYTNLVKQIFALS